MRKTIMALLTLGALTPAFGQGLYFGVNAGYGFSVVSQALDYNSTTTSDGFSNSWTDEVVSGSLGAGFTFGGQVGYMSNDQVGFEVNANYLLGSTIKATSTYTGMGGYSSESTSAHQGKMLNLTPMFVMDLGRDGISPYCKFGLNIGMLGNVRVEYDYSNSDGDSERTVIDFNERLALGFVGEVGARFRFTDKLSLTLGIRGVGMNWAPGHGIITEYTVNGTDVLPQLTTYDKEIDYLNTVSVSTASPPNSNNPSQSLKMYLPFSSVGLNFGFVFSL